MPFKHFKTIFIWCDPCHVYSCNLKNGKEKHEFGKFGRARSFEIEHPNLFMDTVGLHRQRFDNSLGSLSYHISQGKCPAHVYSTLQFYAVNRPNKLLGAGIMDTFFRPWRASVGNCL